jgi:hypothetical protein
MLLRTGLTGLVTLVFTKCEKQAPSELSFVKRARRGPNGVDWRGLTVWMWEQLGRLCVRRDRSGQGELKSCTAPGTTGRPQAASM